jgi:hypothetical protein
MDKVQTGFGVSSAPDAMGTGVSFPEVKWLERDNHSLPSSAEVKISIPMRLNEIHSKFAFIALRTSITRNPFAVWRTELQQPATGPVPLPPLCSLPLSLSLSLSCLPLLLLLPVGGVTPSVQADFLFRLIRRRTHKRTSTKGRRRMRTVKKDKQYRKMK